jgi:hypothetical protein
MIDNEPIGPQITANVTGGGGVLFDSTFDTRLLTNGTHILWGKFVDSANNEVYALQPLSTPLIINNPSGTYSQGSQTVWLGGVPSNLIFFASTVPDLVSYGGNPSPTQATFPMPLLYTPGSNSPALRNNIGAFWGYALSGPRSQEYTPQLFWGTEYNGIDFDPHGVYAANSNVEAPQDTPSAYEAQLFHPYQDGGRCDNYVSPFITYKETPDGSAWFFVEIQGRLGRLDHDGTVTTIVGFTRDKTKLVFDVGNAPREDLANSVRTVVGTFTSPFDLGGVQDIEFDPRNPNILYLANLLDHVIIKVDMTGWPKTPAVCSIWAGQLGVAGYADGAPKSARFNSPSACVMDAGGNLYITDQVNNCIRKITSPSPGVAGTVSTVVGVPGSPTQAQAIANPLTYSPEGIVNFADPAYIVFPSGLRLTSTGNLVIYEPITFNFRLIDLKAHSVRYLGAYNNGASRGTQGNVTAWGQIAVDTRGMIGPKDDVIVAIPGGLQDVTWRVSATSTPYSAVFEGFPGYPNCGVAAMGGQIPKPFHYNWAIEISRHQGKFITSALQSPGNIVFRLANANDPSLSASDIHTLNSGAYIYATGTCTCRGAKSTYFPQAGEGPPANNTWPWHMRPSFWSLRSELGAGHLGIFPGANSFDEMHATYPTDAALGAYIQGGMGGGTPRPEITGNDLRDLIFYIRRNTGAGSTYPTVVHAGADHPDTGNYPIITSISAIRNSATSITVNWTTNKPTIGFAACGSTAQQSKASPYPCFSPIENFAVPYRVNPGGGLIHSATIDHCPSGVTPLHYTVCARDMAGNAVYTSDQTIA